MLVEERLREVFQEHGAGGPERVDRLDRLHQKIKILHRVRVAAASGTAALVAAALAIVPSMADRGGPRVDIKIQGAPALDRCRVEARTMDSNGEVSAMDPDARIIVAPGEEGSHAFLQWVDGRPQRIDGAPGSSWPTPSAVNRAGVVAGTSGYTPAWLYRDGKFATLPLPDGTTAVSVSGIDARGNAAGWVSTPGGRRAVVWPVDRPATVRLLDTPAGSESQALAVTEEGVIVGGLSGSGGSTPYRWKLDGTGTALPGTGEAAYANGDWALSPTGVRWNLRTNRVDAVPRLLRPQIDTNGRVFGAVFTGTHPVVWIDGTTHPLPGLPDGMEGIVSAIGLDGQHILVRSGDPTKYQFLTCT